MSRAALTVTAARGAVEVPGEAWNALVGPDDPFLEHQFLAALERSGSVGEAAGWEPRFVLAHEGGRLVGAVPLYLKDNSYGEFVFDWGWASAAHRAGLSYYPKLVAAVPFTPVTGARLLVHPDADVPLVRSALIDGLRAAAEDTGASSVHVLFCTSEERDALVAAGYAGRAGLQFHWTNRSPAPYRDFGDFLGAFRSRNRKQVRRERAVVGESGVRVELRPGPTLTSEEWEALEMFYETNIDRHGSHRYLSPSFFRELRGPLCERVLAVLAYRGDRPIAGTLNFERGQHLYGRYWGCTEEVEMLHFELCYYRLIEHAITQGHTRFEAGAQGEHKLKRGLLPTVTHSAHWLRHPGLFEAVRRFVDTEARAIEHEVAQYLTMSPYARKDDDEGSS